MLYPVSTPESNSPDDRIGYIDLTGRLVVPAAYKYGSYFFEGLAAVMGDDERTGFIDDRGTVVIPFQFDGLSRFQEGV